jgi:hypothetical protein
MQHATYQAASRLHNQAIASYLQVNLSPHPRSYSGRNMYGKECLGFTFASYNSFLRAALDLVLRLNEPNLAGIERNHLIAALSSGRQESIGRSDIICYFPSLKFDPELASPDREYNAYEEDEEDEQD